MESEEIPNSAIERLTIVSGAGGWKDRMAQYGSQPCLARTRNPPIVTGDATRLDLDSRASQLVAECLCRYSLEGVPTVAPGHSPAEQNCRIAGMAHFMVNQRGFVLSLRDGHEACCTDRFKRSIVITPVWKYSLPSSIH